LLTDEDLAAYQRDGYIIIDEIAPPDEVAWMRKTLVWAAIRGISKITRRG
jgi:hypothetical protein